MQRAVKASASADGRQQVQQLGRMQAPALLLDVLPLEGKKPQI